MRTVGDVRMEATATRLAAAGLRVTAQRVAMLEAFQLGQHLRVDEVRQGVQQRIDRVSTQAVYDALDALTEAGLLRRIEPAGSPMLYEARVGDNHHHLICRGCGAVVDVDCAIGSTPCLEPSHTAGFAIDEAEVVFWGQCPTCASATEGAAS